MANSATNERPVLVDAEFLAKRWSLSEKTIRKWAKEDGILPYVRFSRRAVRFPLAECDELIKSLLVPAAK